MEKYKLTEETLQDFTQKILEIDKGFYTENEIRFMFKFYNVNKEAFFNPLTIRNEWKRFDTYLEAREYQFWINEEAHTDWIMERIKVNPALLLALRTGEYLVYREYKEPEKIPRSSNNSNFKGIINHPESVRVSVC